jgi:mRNA interferase RelE/StbE
MKYQLKVKPKAEKELKKLPRDVYYKILSAFTVLSRDPYIGKKMRGEYDNCYNYRVWSYQIIYEIHKQELVVLVIRVGHRQGVYK